MKDSAVIVSLIACCFLLQGVSAADCVTVKTWNEFTRAVNANDVVTFCPFSIQKTESKRLLVKSEKTLRCAEAKRCTILGPGNHITVRDRSARLILNGFIFDGATNSAIHISNSSAKTHHIIRRCVFRGNYGRKGGAIRTDRETLLSIFSTTFVGNEARAGGGISHAGKFLHIENSVFKENLARRGAGIVLVAAASVELKATKFLGNTATSRGGAISARNAESLDMIVDVTSEANGDCNGVYYRTQKQCQPFDSTGTDDGTTNSCASKGSSCEDMGCCTGLQCSDKSETCEKEEDGATSPYSYSGSACKLIGPEPTFTNTVMKFLAFGDTPYDEEVKKAPFEGSEYRCVRDSILPGVQQLVGAADFMVHVGDIKKGGSGFSEFCNDHVYGSRRDLFKVTEPDLDFLMVVGDNEWNECIQYREEPRANDEAKEMWRKYFTKEPFADFDRVLPYGGSIDLVRQPGLPENFFFYYPEQEIAFFGITEPTKEDRYDAINADWISTKLSNKTPKAVVIFAHSALSRKVVSILPEVPALHVGGNTHKYCMKKGPTPFLLEVTVDAYKASPLLVSIVKDASDNHFFHVEKTPYGC